MAIQYIPPTTTKANRIKIDDTNNNFESNNVEGALNEVINKIRESDAIDDGNISKNSTFSSQKIDSEFDKTNTQLEGVKTDVENLKKNGVGGGTTPNIQVGNVATLEPNEQVTVTRRGTDAEPIFDFSIPRGKTGATGQKGKQGLPGNDGITPNIQIGTVTTLEPNQPATVVNVGTLENPIFDFGIPKGEDGDGAEGLVLDTDKVDYIGGKHETLKETSDANIEYLLRKVNVQKYENSNIVANNSYAKQISNAVLKGVTKYRDKETGEILEEFDNSKNLELVSVKNPTLLITNRIEGISRGLITMSQANCVLINKIDDSNFTIKTTGERMSGASSSRFFTQSMNVEYGTNYVIEFDGKLLKGDLDTANGVSLSAWSDFVEGYNGKLPINGKYRAIIKSLTNPANDRYTSFTILTTNHVHITKEVEYQIRNLKVYPVNNNDDTYKSSKINITGEYRSLGQLSDTLDLNTGEIIQCSEVMDVNKIPDNEFGDFSINGANGVTPNTCNINIHKAVLHKYFPKYSTKVLPMCNFKKCEGTTFGKDYECIALHDDEIETLQINLSHERFNGELTKQKAIEIVKSLNIKLIYLLKEPIKKKINIDERLYSYDGTTYFTCISSSEYLPPILAIEIPTDISSLISDQEIEIQQLKNENEKLKQMDNELVANSWDIDFRTCEIEWFLEDAGLTGTDLMNELSNNKKTNISKYEQAKIMITGKVYDRETLTRQLTRYLEKKIITQQEHEELIALMEAKELVAGE